MKTHDLKDVRLVIGGVEIEAVDGAEFVQYEAPPDWKDLRVDGGITSEREKWREPPMRNLPRAVK